jgi:pyridoxal phosphate enzyme (YggS family)
LENFLRIRAALGNVTLIAVSKTKPVEAIMALYNQGQRAFGENKVQEMLEKWEALPKDIEWHLIGHLQRNKVKYIAPFVHMIHSVDSVKLLFEIEKEAVRCQRSIDVLLQMHIASEETKFGMDNKELIELLDYYTAQPEMQRYVRIRGLMGMATNTDNKEIVRKEFAHLRNQFLFVQQSYFPGMSHFSELSMGMSSDYKIAIEEGSTMVRIGSLLFGER